MSSRHDLESIYRFLRENNYAETLATLERESNNEARETNSRRSSSSNNSAPDNNRLSPQQTATTRPHTLFPHPSPEPVVAKGVSVPNHIVFPKGRPEDIPESAGKQKKPQLSPVSEDAAAVPSSSSHGRKKSWAMGSMGEQPRPMIGDESDEKEAEFLRNRKTKKSHDVGRGNSGNVMSSSRRRRSDGRKQRVVIVSYRLPIQCEYNLETNEWMIEWEANEKCNFLHNMLEIPDYEIVFVGWPQLSDEYETTMTPDMRELLEETLRVQFRIYPVFIESEMRHKFYDCYCKRILWPLFHYSIPSSDNYFGKEYETYWNAYSAVNISFARKALTASVDDIGGDGDGDGDVTLDLDEKDALIWFQNYHLCLCPHFIRRYVDAANIGLFIHTPFPTSEIFRCLPSRMEILRGMLSSDLIGFSTYDYSRHFLSACKRILDLDYETSASDGSLFLNMSGRKVFVDISHTGILSESVLEMVKSGRTTQIQSEERHWCQKFEGRRVIFGMGDTDVVRGSQLVIQSFSNFLENNVEWIDKVVFVQFVGEVYTENEEMNVISRGLRGEVEAIVSKYGREVIHVIEQSNEEERLSYHELLALFGCVDVALFTTFWDGFNTVPFDFTLSQFGKDVPGAMIISEFMGCHRALQNVYKVNPWQVNHVSDCILSALVETNEERMKSQLNRFEYVMKHSFTRWAHNWLGLLNETSRVSKQNKHAIVLGINSTYKLIYLKDSFLPLKEMSAILTTQFEKCLKRVCLFDYGGTLISDARSHGNPSGLRLDENVKEALRVISVSRNTLVAIVSGHTMKEIDSIFGDVPSLLLTAEKGAFYRLPNERTWRTNREAIGNVSEWMPIAKRIMTTYCERTSGSHLVTKKTGLVWHYHNADPQYGDMQAREMERYLSSILGNPTPDMVGTRSRSKQKQKRSRSRSRSKSPGHHGGKYSAHVLTSTVDFVRYEHAKLLEVLPGGINKGTCVDSILSRVLAMDGDGDESESELKGQDVFVICVGNDKGDESMYSSVENFQSEWQSESCFTCSIGIKPTSARYYLSDQSEMMWLLNLLKHGATFLEKTTQMHVGSESESERPTWMRTFSPGSEAVGQAARGRMGQMSGTSHYTPIGGSTGNLAGLMGTG